MKVQGTGIGKEFSVYTVDGREIEVPTDIRFPDRKDTDDFITCYWVVDAIDKNTREPIDANTRSAIADHILRDGSETNIKIEVITEQ